MSDLKVEDRIAAWEIAIRTFLITGSGRKAAEAAGVTPKTWNTWKRHDDFQKLLERRREQAAHITTAQMGELFLSAIEVHHEAMQPIHDIDVRLKAARAVMQHFGSATKTLPQPLLVEARTVDASDAAAELERRKVLEAGSKNVDDPEPSS